MENNISILKEKLLRMAPRPFGEGFGEWLFFQLDSKLKERIDGSHDALYNNKKCEIKISRAILKEKKSKKTNWKSILLESTNYGFVRLNSDDKFDCNIQQVKPKYFDTILYGVFFEEGIYLFKTDSETIKNDKNIGYVDKQHRGNIGEGQFHIKRNNINYHIDNFLYKKLSWNELIEIIRSIDE